MAVEPVPRQGWTDQEGIQFEVTREIVGQVIGLCSGKIGEQNRSAHPDQEVITAWRHEQADWATRRRALDASDNAAVIALAEAAVERRDYLRSRDLP